MPLRQPKPKQIRLPFDVPRPKKGVDAPVRACGVCKVADSRYTCPRCNLPYCSLACFRDQTHAQCSEPFYRSTVMDQIALDPEAEAGEKRKMISMLRRFEEAHADGEDLTALEDEEDNDELSRALEGVDLDSVDSNTLLRLLPQEHRDAFLAAIQDPNSAEAKALLQAAVDGGVGDDDDAKHVPTVLPWWEADDLDNPGELIAERPPSIDPAVVGSLKPSRLVAQKLIYNLTAICIAYVHSLLSLRLPSLDPVYIAQQDLEPKEVKRELGDLLPFLLDPSSTVRYESVRDAWGAVWEAIGRLDGAQDPKTLVFLLQKIAPLLHPPITTDPPRAIGVLDDLYRLLAAPKPGAAAKKIVFYAAAMTQLGRADWLDLETEIGKEVERLREEVEDEGASATDERAVPLVDRETRVNTGPAKIELLD